MGEQCCAKSRPDKKNSYNKIVQPQPVCLVYLLSLFVHYPPLSFAEPNKQNNKAPFVAGPAVSAEQSDSVFLYACAIELQHRAPPPGGSLFHAKPDGCIKALYF